MTKADKIKTVNLMVFRSFQNIFGRKRFRGKRRRFLLYGVR
nr:MAG TPA: hypothetical protein [Caudoviricetes sp.]